MNDDDFETKLAALTGALRRPDPTPSWKAEILARARREAHPIPLIRRAPPGWLMLSWAAAWAAVLVLIFSTPRELARNSGQSVADASFRHGSALAGIALNQPDPTLLAFQQHMNLNLDLP